MGERGEPQALGGYGAINPIGFILSLLVSLLASPHALPLLSPCLSPCLVSLLACLVLSLLVSPPLPLLSPLLPCLLASLPLPLPSPHIRIWGKYSNTQGNIKACQKRSKQAQKLKKTPMLRPLPFRNNLSHYFPKIEKFPSSQVRMDFLKF